MLRVLFLFLPFFCLSQEISGLSVFRIGDFTPKKLDSIAQSKKQTITQCHDDFCGINNYYLQIIPKKSITKDLEPGNFSKNVKIYTVRDYYLLNKYLLKNVYLYFFKDKLYKIEVSAIDSQLILDLEFKYKNFEIVVDEYLKKCNISGHDLNLKNTRYTKKWQNNTDSIQMQINSLYGFDSLCRELKNSKIIIFDKEIDKIAQEEIDAIKKEISILESREKEIILKDL